MRKFLVIAVMAFLLGIFFWAPTKSGGCYSRHMNEAIELNQARFGPYSDLSNGRSILVSSALIFMEKSSLFLAKIWSKYDFDQRDRSFSRRGVPVMCNNLIEMSLTPEFQTSRGQVFEGTHNSLDAKQVARSLETAYLNGGFQGLKSEVLSQINQLPEKRTNCLLRHFLESIGRASALAPLQIKLSEDRGLSSPQELIEDFIEFHLLGLSMASWIDRLALPIQEQGVPILCQDVPHIPIP